MSVELRHLRYFVAVADELSFTRAAQRLRISQPPLSQQIQDLEAILKTQLLLRTSRRVELTAAGEALHARAKSILEQVDAAARETVSIGQGEKGRILIGATGSIVRGGLADLLAAYRHEFPDVTTTLFEQAPKLQMRALAGEEHRHQLHPPAPGGRRFRQRTCLARGRGGGDVEHPSARGAQADRAEGSARRGVRRARARQFGVRDLDPRLLRGRRLSAARRA